MFMLFGSLLYTTQENRMCDAKDLLLYTNTEHLLAGAFYIGPLHKGNNKITEFRTILQRESQNS
jgi:hypothetical protein